MSEMNLPSIVWSGDAHNCLEQTSDGGGVFPDGYQLTSRGVAVVAKWLTENASADFEDCDACTVVNEGGHDGYCPVHLGAAAGIDDMCDKLKALGDDPELFALIPVPTEQGDPR
ncbi:hypothetical protein [Brevibacterium sp. XM4083]|uniref:hypothetical protein n=1 Tax=Brevibacterium sp. XM4083 TaxID=2583238 RepID=UPI00112CB434|nr:hypothetical protein [Brevibacterium sp. XM4083]MCM1011919.1 hypothetical protein [Brevibacterium sp. XM4083]